VAIAYDEVSVEMTSSSMPLPRAMPHAEHAKHTKHTEIELFILWVSPYAIFMNCPCQTFSAGPAASEPNNK
jgi:hypothetical protein